MSGTIGPIELDEAICKAERDIVRTLGYEIHGIVEAVRTSLGGAWPPAIPFDARIVSLLSLVREVRRLKRLCELRRGTHSPETEEEREDRYEQMQVDLAIRAGEGGP